MNKKICSFLHAQAYYDFINLIFLIMCYVKVNIKVDQLVTGTELNSNTQINQTISYKQKKIHLLIILLLKLLAQKTTNIKECDFSFSSTWINE